MLGLWLFASLAQISNPKPPSPDRVVATLNGKAVTAKEIEGYLWAWRGYEATQEVISLKVAEEAAAKEKVTAPDAEVRKVVDQAIESLRTDYKRQQSKLTFENFLLERGFPESRIYLRAKTQVLVEQIALKDFVPGQWVKVSTLVYRPENEQTSSLSATIGKADNAYGRLVHGTATWDKELAAIETDPMILRSHGIVGWQRLSVFPKTVSVELQMGKVGLYTKPAQTINGIQIFRLDAKGGTPDPAESAELKKAFLAFAEPAVVARLRAQAKITTSLP